MLEWLNLTLVHLVSLKSEELKVNEDDQSKLMSRWKGPWSCSLHAFLCFSNGFLSAMKFQSFHNLIKRKVCDRLWWTVYLPSVWDGRPLCHEVRASHREAVRLRPRSQLQLLPAEVHLRSFFILFHNHSVTSAGQPTSFMKAQQLPQTVTDRRHASDFIIYICYASLPEDEHGVFLYFWPFTVVAC